jgi:MoxR-like ATPase
MKFNGKFIKMVDKENLQPIIIDYKGFKIQVEVKASVSSDYLFVISEVMSLNDKSNSVTISFDEDVFFDKFKGNDIAYTDYEAITASIKRAFVRYIKDNPNKADEGDDMTAPKSKGSDEPTGAIDKIIFDTVSRALSSSGTKAEISTHIKELIKQHGIVPHRTILEVKYKDLEKKDVGIQHKDFPKILKTLSTGVNLCLVGPAGSGKTTIVYNAAKALNLSFASQSVSAQSTVFDFFGYKSADGSYIGTLFREKYEKGGVFLLDEFDAGNPNVLAALNQATANGHCPFPDSMIKKHDDFIMIMAGNTFGGGGTIEYVGRNKIDAATLDRFAFVFIDYDEKLENDLSTNAWWCSRVQQFRALATAKKVRTIISPRATFFGEKLLNAGIEQSEVEEMLIYKGLTKDERDLIKL